MLYAQSTTKDYIRSENKLEFVSKLFIPQVITPQVFFFSQTTIQLLSTISERKTRKTITLVLGPVYFLRSLSMGTCIQQDDLFFLLYGPTQEPVLATANTEKNSGEVFGKKCR